MVSILEGIVFNVGDTDIRTSYYNTCYMTYLTLLYSYGQEAMRTV